MGDPAKLQPLFLLDDEPIVNAADDFLSREDDARTIAGAVLGTTGPFSVGIYGEWGTGKTSLLHHVKSLLEAKEREGSPHLAYPYLVTVLFNAWQHEKDAEPLAHLAEAVDAAVTKRLKDVQTLTGKVEEKAIEWLRSAHMASRALIYASSIESGADPVKDLAKASGFTLWKLVPFLRFSPKDAIDRYEKLQQESGNPDSKAWTAHIKQSVTRAVLHSFRTKHALLDKVRPGKEHRIPRVVIFIDDMDRCTPEDAFKLLQSIKLAIAQPGFVFVMTLDPAALQPFLEKKVGEAGLAASAGSKAIYLDKLVQLPYPLRLHDEQFAGFVNKIVDVRLKEMLPAPQWDVFTSLATVLELSSQRNPRTLIRRINGLLVDARIASPAIKSGLDPDPAKADGVFMGLCLIRHTLKHFVGDSLTAQLSASQSTCNQIVFRGLSACLDRGTRLAALDAEEAAKERTSSPAGWSEAARAARADPDEADLKAAVPLLRELNRVRCLNDLFKTDAGKRWLSSKDERDLVETFYAKRPEATAKGSKPETTQPVAATPTIVPTDEAPIGPTTPGDKLVAAAATTPARPPLPESEREIIERAIRGAINLPAGATLDPTELARVTELNLASDPITDAGAAWLARPDSGLTALTTLYLGKTQVGDAGAAALAAKGSGLTALTMLHLAGTQVGDAGAAALAAKDSGLTALTKLNLASTQVGDAGAAALAAKDSGLTALTTLHLFNTQVGDAGAAALAAKDPGLRALTTLNLSYTQVGDAGAAALAAKDSGLTALTTLSLDGTKITDAGAAALAAKDSGLTALTTLHLFNTQVGDAGAAALAAKDSGLKALTTLDLSSTQVGDAGAAALAAKDSGLTALTTLYLLSTQVGDAGAAALAAKDSGLTALTKLNLAGTQVGDAGAAALAAKDSGLTALTTLHLAGTQVGDAGAAALAAKDSGLTALSTLNLYNTQVGDAGAAAIRKAHPNLQVID